MCQKKMTSTIITTLEYSSILVMLENEQGKELKQALSFMSLTWNKNLRFLELRR